MYKSILFLIRMELSLQSGLVMEALSLKLKKERRRAEERTSFSISTRTLLNFWTSGSCKGF